MVGCGHWGKNLVRNVHQLGHFYGVCEAKTNLLDTLRAQYGPLKAFATLTDVCADENVDAVMLVTPAEHHFAMGVQLLRAANIFSSKSRWRSTRRKGWNWSAWPNSRAAS